MSIHLKGLRPGDLGEATIIVGDPARVRLISDSWDDTRQVTGNREFDLVVGTWHGSRVSICSTGIGAGSTEIAVTELIENGAKAIVRCGGCGAWQDGIEPGQIIMNHAMARSEGLMSAYVPETFPAAADPFLVSGICAALRADGLTVHTGVGLTSETYYLGQGRRPGIETPVEPPSSLMDFWRARGILNCEMETAVLYVLGALYHVPVANSLVVHVSRTNERWASDADYASVHRRAAEAVLSALLNR